MLIYLMGECIFYEKLLNLRLVERRQLDIFLNIFFMMIVIYCIILHSSGGTLVAYAVVFLLQP